MDPLSPDSSGNWCDSAQGQMVRRCRRDTVGQSPEQMRPTRTDGGGMRQCGEPAPSGACQADTKRSKSRRAHRFETHRPTVRAIEREPKRFQTPSYRRRRNTLRPKLARHCRSSVLGRGACGPHEMDACSRGSKRELARQMKLRRRDWSRIRQAAQPDVGCVRGRTGRCDTVRCGRLAGGFGASGLRGTWLRGVSDPPPTSPIDEGNGGGV